MLAGLLDEIQDKKPLYIILDGLQHLSDYDDAKMLNWLPVVPDNVSLIVTAPYHDATQEIFYRRYNSVFCLEAFEQDKERLFVEKYLGKFGKRLSPRQINTILQAYSSADPSPKGVKDILTLKSLLNELVFFGSYELLDKQIAYYCENNLALFYPRMFERMENDYGFVTVRNIFCYIAYSRAGLSESEILDVSDATIMQWSNVRYAISHLLTIRNGKYYIDKITINSQIVRRYGKDEKTIRQKLVNHFKQISDDRAIEECLFQYYQLQDYDALYKTILNIDVFYHLYHNGGLAELLPYRKALYDSNKKKYRIDSYVKIQTPVTKEYAHTFYDMGQFAKQVLGEQNAAETLFSKSMDLYESILHTDYDTLANVYLELGIYDKALENIDKSLPLAKILFSENGTYYPEMMLSKGAILLKMGQTKQAVEIWREALDEVFHSVGENNIMASALYRNLAGAYFFLKDDDCFKEYIEKSIVVIGKTVGEEHIYMGDAFYLYGVFHEQAQHAVEALDFYHKALKIYKKWYPGNHTKVLETEKRIKQLQSKKGGSLMESIINSMCANLPDWLVDTQEKYPLSDSDFQDVLNFFEGIADDLYLVDEGWEDGMKEYVYNFRYKHDCHIGGNRYVYDPNDHNIYIYMDSDGRYNSCGKSFDNLKDAQVHYLMRWYSFYELYCHYKNIR